LKPYPFHYFGPGTTTFDLSYYGQLPDPVVNPPKPIDPPPSEGFKNKGLTATQVVYQRKPGETQPKLSLVSSVSRGIMPKSRGLVYLNGGDDFPHFGFWEFVEFLEGEAEKLLTKDDFDNFNRIIKVILDGINIPKGDKADGPQPLV